MNGKPSNPRDDVMQTYFALRIALGSLALGLPPALYLIARAFQGIGLQPSISAYYHSDARDVFVGALWAIGLGLIAYKGFSRREDWALNLGGVLACCIAFFPMPPDAALSCILHGPTTPDLAASSLYDRTAAQVLDAALHFPAAVTFYLVLGFVMIFCAHHTLHLVPARERRLYLAAYPALGMLFVGSMVVVYVLLKLVFEPGEACRDHWVFGVEVAGIVSFAAFWFLKTAECQRHDTDRRIPHRHQPQRTLPPQAPAPSGAPDASRKGAQGMDATQPVPTEPSTQAKRQPSPWEDYLSLWRLDRPAD